jgi:WW domain-containing oxidoreductase
MVLAERNLSGKTYIVTGANAGIGFETARALAAKSGRVIVACRSEDKADETAARIKALHADATVESGVLDLASFESIRAFVDALKIERLDGLVGNAGVIHNDYRETQEGHEMTVGVCHIGHFLLTSLLMPQLRAAAAETGDARVIMVASESHHQPAKLQFNRFLLSKDNYKFMVAYGQAKLCNVLFANEFDRRFAGDGIRACSLHPGTMVTTGIARNTALGRFAMAILTPFTKNPHQGAATSVYCAAYGDPQEIGGVYFSDCKPKKMSREAASPDVASKLWDMSEEWCGKFGG